MIWKIWMKCEMKWKIWKKIVKKIWKLWKKGKSNSEDMEKGQVEL